MSSKRGPKRQRTFLQDWNSLPSLLLNSTLEKLSSLHDYFRFGFVSKHWRKVALDQKLQRLESSQKQLAPLMLLHRVPPPSTFVSYKRRRELYNVTQAKVIRSFNIPYYRDDEDPPRLCGSSHGWLAYVDASFTITLLNPFINESIILPCMQLVTKKKKTKPECNNKVVLSASRTLFPNEYQVLVIFKIDEDTNKLAHLKSGDKSWTHSDELMIKGLDIVDATYYKGRFLALDGRFYSPLERNSRVLRKIHPCIACISRPRQHFSSYSELLFLVKSTCDDLLLVSVDTNMSSSKNRSRIFKLASLAEDGSPKWIEINSLGNKDALFVDKMNAICSSTS